MQLLRVSEVQAPSDAPVFSYSRLRAVLLAACIVVVAVFLLFLGWQQPGGIARYVSYYAGAMLLLCLFFLRGYMTARFRASNWLARVTPAGVFIKFRSYLNYALPDSDKTVVFIPYQEIHSAGLFDERAAAMDPEGHRTTQTIRYVQFDISTDISALADALSAERSKPAPRERHWYGTSSTLYNDYPVRVVPPSFVQVQWGAVPGRGAFLDALRPFVQIAPPMSNAEDFTKLASLPRDQQVQRLRELDAAGHTILAIATARRLYGYDLAHAKSFVEALRSR